MALPSSSSSHIIAMFNKIFHPRFFTSHSLAAPATKHKTLYDLSHANVSRMPNTFHSYPPSSVSEWKNIYDVRININRPHSPLSRNLWAFFSEEEVLSNEKIHCRLARHDTVWINDFVGKKALSKAPRNVVRKPKNKSCKQLNSLSIDERKKHRGKSFPIELFCLWFWDVERRGILGIKETRKITRL